MDVLVMGWRWSLLCAYDVLWLGTSGLTYSMCTKAVEHMGLHCVYVRRVVRSMPSHDHWFLVCDGLGTWLQDLVEPLKSDLTCVLFICGSCDSCQLCWFTIGESWDKTWVTLWGFYLWYNFCNYNCLHTLQCDKAVLQFLLVETTKSKQ